MLTEVKVYAGCQEAPGSAGADGRRCPSLHATFVCPRMQQARAQTPPSRLHHERHPAILLPASLVSCCAHLARFSVADDFELV